MNDTLMSGETPQPKEFLPEYVGEGKKFRDAEALAKSKYEADQFIETLKREQAELRKDYLSLREETQLRANLQDLLDQMKAAKDNQIDNTQSNDNKPQFDPSQLKSLVQAELQEHEVAKQQAQNMDLVRNKLKERWGDQYLNHYRNQLDALQITAETADNLARTMPGVFMRTFGLDTPAPREGFQAPPASSRRSDNFAPNTPKKDWSYYEDLRKKDPAAYWDPKIQVEMHKYAQENPESFGLS